ncbi:TetR/AcrR family transcriptional regulator [Amycolatopsis sp. NPDC006131]|uniref:TetR/AcrR family transcriptional regulator n=1 Tax=Amycolatopsis sp. NPDC006131 TaxID=3156731 RepID=UPI0033A34B80
MPKLWNDTIDAHRREVREATMEAAAALVTEQGLRAVTMSRVAERAGIGRATLYKYFPDVETILRAWHERQIAAHLEHLVQARDGADTPAARLEAVLQAYAFVSHHTGRHHDTELAAFLHQDEQVAKARQQLRTLVRDLLAEGAAAGVVRVDIPSDELTTYCLHALSASTGLRAPDAVERLVKVTLAGLRSPG